MKEYKTHQKIENNETAIQILDSISGYDPRARKFLLNVAKYIRKIDHAVNGDEFDKVIDDISRIPGFRGGNGDTMAIIMFGKRNSRLG